MIANAAYHGAVVGGLAIGYAKPFAVMGIGAVVNAVAFSEANSLFTMSTEAERENESDAKEKFQEDLAAWNQRKLKEPNV